jgi:hypothetical protein
MHLTRHLFETITIAATVGSCVGLSSPALAQSATPPLSGSVILPTPTPRFEGAIGRKASESRPDFPKAITAPNGAPNILLILTDDTGFGASSTFGGPIPTPQHWTASLKAACATITSTPPRFARPRALRFLPVAITIASALAISRSSLPVIRATIRFFRRAPERLLTFSSTTATTRPGSAKTI